VCLLFVQWRFLVVVDNRLGSVNTLYETYNDW
jgi:hypothetical protein